MNKRFALIGLSVGSLGMCLAAPARATETDPPETKNVEVIVVNKDANGTAKLREQVVKEIEKSNISKELKEEVLKKMDEALKKADTAASRVDKATGKIKGMLRANANAKKLDDGKSEEVTVTIVNGSDDENDSKEGKKFQLFGNILNPHRQHVKIFRSAEDKDGGSFRIGVACEEIDGADTQDQKSGLRIVSVVEGSPAEKAGIEKGDVVVTVNAQSVQSVGDMMAIVQDAGKKDTAVTVEVNRDDKTMNVSVKPIKMKAPDAEINDIDLSIPEGGFLLAEDAMKKFQGRAHVLFGAHETSDLKKEIDAIKSEISEIRKMLKELIDKK